MSSQLEYKAPISFMDGERKHKDRITPDMTDERSYPYPYQFYFIGHEKMDALAAANRKYSVLTASPFDRGLAAWYLKACGVSFVEIGARFEISTACARSAVAKVQNQVCSNSYRTRFNRSFVKFYEKTLFPTVSVDVRRAHQLTQSFIEMRSVEFVMLQIHGSTTLRSGALRLGQQKFQLRRNEVGEHRCVCRDCKGFVLPKMSNVE